MNSRLKDETGIHDDAAYVIEANERDSIFYYTISKDRWDLNIIVLHIKWGIQWISLCESSGLSKQTTNAHILLCIVKVMETSTSQYSKKGANLSVFTFMNLGKLILFELHNKVININAEAKRCYFNIWLVLVHSKGAKFPKLCFTGRCYHIDGLQAWKSVLF